MKLKNSSLNWALKHVLKEGDTDMFPEPFEFKIIKKFWSNIEGELLKIEINTHSWEGPRRLVVPKSEFGFRPVCQLAPLDAILFAALIKEIGRKIEKRRSPPNKVFSYRFNPTRSGKLYRSTTGWEGFWQTSEQYCDKFSHVLVTDISDYYNQIYHHTIENQLDECGVGKSYWYAIRNLISNVSEGVSRGIPIGPHPAHLLAELAMIPIDQFLESLAVPYCRYVDDIHIFCGDLQTAHSTLYKLVDQIDKTQKMQLSRQKTKIIGAEDFGPICRSSSVDKPINKSELNIIKEIKSHTKGPYERMNRQNAAFIRKTIFSSRHIESVLGRYINDDEINYVRLRWFIRRITQIGAPGGIEFIIRNFNKFLPAISEVGQYLEAASPNYQGKWCEIGSELIKLHNLDIVQASEYLQVVILGLFSAIKDLNHVNQLTRLYDESSPMCQRKIMLAASEAKAGAWLSKLKSEYKNAGPWNRRAIIYSLRGLPEDEREHWLKSVERRVDGLDKYIVKYVA